MELSLFAGKNILVTGGTGTLGREIVKDLLIRNSRVVRVYSRDEGKQYELLKELGRSEQIRYLLGDVRDYERLRLAMEGIDYVFHTAALKHVDFCEYNSFEAVKTNVFGTQNVIRASMECGVKKVLFISTDKAVSPGCVMGASKLMAEKLMTAAQYFRGFHHKTILSTIRLGNVLGSRGSVINLFKEQILQGKPVTLTDRRMSRYILSIRQAVGLILKTMEISCGGEVFIPKMPRIRILDLIEALQGELGASGANEVEEIGIKVGEKIDEELITQEEASRCWELKDFYVILPGTKFSEVLFQYPDKVASSVTILPDSSAPDFSPLANDELIEFLRTESLI